MIILKKDSLRLAVETLKDIPGTDDFIKRTKYKLDLKADEVTIDPNDLNPGHMAMLKKAAEEGEDRSMLMQLNLMERIASNPGATKITRLKNLTQAVERWVIDGSINGWIFIRDEKTDELMPYSVESVKYDSPMHGHDSVKVVAQANAPTMKGSERERELGSTNIAFWQNSLPATVDQLMASRGVMHETPELIAEYEEAIKRHKEILAKPNEQFRIAPGQYRKTGSYRNEHSFSQPHRGINDETLLTRSYREYARRDHWEEVAKEMDLELAETAFADTPTHPLHLVFDLQSHTHIWATSQTMTEYVYKPEKVNLLVLPDDHRELIDILTHDTRILQEDVVENKTGGSTVLLEGEPGLGKTLLPSVYSEAMRRPLYSVQAGQLGVTAEDVAKGLETVYANTARWGAVLLIDEADTYCRKRDNDLSYNAVVAAILGALESQASDLPSFFTTNRSDDLDEAVMSRCIAIVRFEKPVTDDAREIWRIQAEVLDIDVPEEAIEEALSKWEGENGRQRTAGRDIRAILKLVKRYITVKKVPATMEIITKMAAFKRF